MFSLFFRFFRHLNLPLFIFKKKKKRLATLVAGVAAGTSVGVAKKANIISVEVFDQYGRGTLSGVISGLGWITKYARHCNCSVINMSFGIPSSYSGVQLLNDAVTSAVNKGFPVFASAGDSAVDACTDVPGSNSKVFTVASTNNTDYPDPNTNFGKCVSMNAPGVNIITDWISTNSAQAMISGSRWASFFYYISFSLHVLFRRN